MRSGFVKIKLSHSYSDIISLNNLSFAWGEFVVGKKNKPDVQIFSRNLMDNIVELHQLLVNKTYHHDGYESFYITDPKRRHINKATVRDRLLHHAVYRMLYPFFDRTFIADSFSCRNDKGVHKGINRFRNLAKQESKNFSRACWVLKCDIQKFFANIDHRVLLSILEEYIFDKNILWLLQNIINSFCTESKPGVGLPLGNLTSQLFANVYMNRFDQWVKHKLKAKYYARYADDFVFLSHDKSWLEGIVPQIKFFLQTNLKLSLHPNKLILKTIASGVDFLGWVNFPDHRILRATTRRRMLARIKIHPTKETLQSYLGLLIHGNAKKNTNDLLGEYWFWQ